MKNKIFALSVCFFLLNYSFSQKKNFVKIELISKILDTIHIDTIQVISFEIVNFSNEKIFVTNVPILLLDYQVKKKVSQKYIPLDSICVFSPLPIYPLGGSKIIRFRKNKKLIIKTTYPIGCTMYENGDYRIKFSFTYYLKNRRYKAETKWYNCYINIKK